MVAIRNILIGIGFVCFLLIGSCTLLGMKAASTVQTMANQAAPAIEGLKDEIEKERIERHNERMNRESSLDEE